MIGACRRVHVGVIVYEYMCIHMRGGGPPVGVIVYRWVTMYTHMRSGPPCVF